MAPEIFINEVLCFVKYNYDRLTTSQLKPILSNFYKDEVLIEAKELLLKSLQGIAINDIPRMPKRQGDNKGKKTVDDILQLYSIVDEQKLVDILPRFTAEDLSKIPFMNADSVNVVTMAKRLEYMDQRISALEQMAGNAEANMVANAEANETAYVEANTMTPLLDTDSSAVVSVDEAYDSSDLSVLMEVPSNQNVNSWSTAIKRKTKNLKNTVIPGDSNVTASTVFGQSGPDSPHRQSIPQVKSTLSQHGNENKQKIRGLRQGNFTNSSVKPAIVKKAVFHIDNLDSGCNEESLTEFLNTNKIDVLSCFKTKSWLRDAEKNKAIAFRVCVQSTKRQQILDPQLWTAGIIIRDWKFKANKNGGEHSASQTGNV